MSVLVQAIEKAKSIDASKVREVLVNNTFPTVVGNVMFDGNGQTRDFSFEVQQYRL